MNCDLGRLGGLLTLWLAKDPRMAAFNEQAVRVLLTKIDDAQDELRVVMQTILRAE